ncbi:DUF2892 domain-containing protein [bacterium]|nr:DUF2892 domain-containing protein [bacterium]
MKKNIGTVDRILRIAFAGLVGGLYAKHLIHGNVAIALGAFAAVFLLTSLISYCPLYTILGVSTCEKK